MAYVQDIQGPDDAHTAEQAGELANSSVFLALYLILLGFFLMLDAHADLSEARSQAAIESLRLDIAPRPEPVPETTALAADPLEQRLNDIFRNHLPKGEWDLVTREGRILVRLPQRRAFSPDSSVLQPGRISMMRRLAGIIGEAQAVEGLRVSVTVGVGNDSDLARRRAASLARDMLRFGVAHDRFDIGTDRAADGSIEFHLRPPAEGDFG